MNTLNKHTKIQFMAAIGIFYGSTTGNTEKIAEMIRNEFGHENADIYNVDIVIHHIYFISV